MINQQYNIYSNGYGLQEFKKFKKIRVNPYKKEKERPKSPVEFNTELHKVLDDASKSMPNYSTQGSTYIHTRSTGILGQTNSNTLEGNRTTYHVPKQVSHSQEHTRGNITGRSKTARTNARTELDSHKTELNQVNFVKKLKTLSRTHTTLSVKALEKPKIGTDVYKVNTMRINPKNECYDSKFDRHDECKSKIRTTEFPNYAPLIEEQQISNANFQYETKKWKYDLINDKKSKIEQSLHHYGLTPARVGTLKFHDVTNSLFDLYKDRHMANEKKVDNMFQDIKQSAQLESKVNKIIAHDNKWQKTLSCPNLLTKIEHTPHQEFKNIYSKPINDPPKYDNKLDMNMMRTMRHTTTDYNQYLNKANTVVTNLNVPEEKIKPYKNKTFVNRVVNPYDQKRLKTIKSMYKDNMYTMTDRGMILLNVNQIDSVDTDKIIKLDHYVNEQTYVKEATRMTKYYNNCFGEDDGITKNGFSSYYPFNKKLMNVKKHDHEKLKSVISSW